MKKQFFFIFISLFLFYGKGLRAQTPSSSSVPVKMTYEKALQTALENSKVLQSRKLNIRLRDNEADKNRAKILPSVTGGYDFRYNTQLQTNVLPPEAFPAIPGQERREQRIQFGTTFNHTFAFNVNQPIYLPGNHSDRELTAQNRTLETLNLQKEETDLRLEVAQSYYAVLWNLKKEKLAKENVVRAETYYQTAQTRLSQGTLVRTDADKFYLDIVNARSAYRRDSNNLEQSKKQLAYRLSIDPNTPLEIEDDLEKKISSLNFLPDEKEPVRERIEMRLEKSRYDLNALGLNREKRNYLPSLSAYGNYTFQQLNNDFNPFNFDKWTTFNYIGLNLSVSLFDGRLKERNKEGHRLMMQINETNMEKLRNDFNYEIQSAKTELVNALINFDYALKNVRLAERILETERVKHREGTLLYQDLRATEFSLQQAENNMLNVMYDYVLARLKWERAAGVL